MSAIANPLKRVPGRCARVVDGMFVAVKYEVPRTSQRDDDRSDTRAKLSGRRCIKRKTVQPIPGLESRLALLERMYAAVERIGGEAVARRLGFTTSISQLPWMNTDDTDGEEAPMRAITNPNRPAWSARHYHAVLRVWKRAEADRDAPLKEQCERAMDWLLDRMTSHSDRLRMETSTIKRDRRKKKLVNQRG
jgi:hypothetical protein